MYMEGVIQRDEDGKELRVYPLGIAGIEHDIYSDIKHVPRKK